jgi:hypothetical protein
VPRSSRQAMGNSRWAGGDAAPSLRPAHNARAAEPLVPPHGSPKAVDHSAKCGAGRLGCGERVGVM